MKYDAMNRSSADVGHKFVAPPSPSNSPSSENRCCSTSSGASSSDCPTPQIIVLSPNAQGRGVAKTDGGNPNFSEQSRVVHVSELSPDVDMPRLIWSLKESYGPISYVKMGPTGEAKVEFEDIAHAFMCLRQGAHEVEEKPVIVKPANVSKLLRNSQESELPTNFLRITSYNDVKDISPTLEYITQLCAKVSEPISAILLQTTPLNAVFLLEFTSLEVARAVKQKFNGEPIECGRVILEYASRGDPETDRNTVSAFWKYEYGNRKRSYPVENLVMRSTRDMMPCSQPSTIYPPTPSTLEMPSPPDMCSVEDAPMHLLSPSASSVESEPKLSSDEACPSSKKGRYQCQQCLNHGLSTTKRGHKCPNKSCDCEKCRINVERRIQNHAVARSNPIDSDRYPDPIDLWAEQLGEKPKYCRKCRNHLLQIPLKDHKKDCRFKECPCASCTAVSAHRKVMADQTRLRRKQKDK